MCRTQEPLVRDVCSLSSHDDATSSSSSKPDSPTDIAMFTNKECSSHWRGNRYNLRHHTSATHNRHDQHIHGDNDDDDDYVDDDDDNFNNNKNKKKKKNNNNNNKDNSSNNQDDRQASHTPSNDGQMDWLPTLTPPIQRIPPEILMLIFGKLPSTSHLLSCMLVCRSWAMATVPILWHRPTCNNWRSLASVVASVNKQGALFAYADLIRRLNLSALHESVSTGTLVPFLKCEKIERLTLTNCTSLGDQPVSDLVARNHLLQALDVTDVDSLTDRTVLKVAENCPRIQGLNLTGCVLITDDALVTVARSCSQLKRIKLNNITNVNDSAVTAISQSCPGLVEIDLFNCPQITSASVVQLLTNLPVLRELRLGYCVLVDDNAFTTLPDDTVFDSLRILDLAGLENLRDAALCKIINQAPKLRNLVLAKCRLLTDRTLYSISRLGKNLHYLHLGHVWNITDNGLLHLIRSCNRIRYIDLACCSRLTDRSICALAGLPKLRRIGLVKCQNITDASIRAIAGVALRPHQRMQTHHLGHTTQLQPLSQASSTYPVHSSFTPRATADFGHPAGANPLERVHLSYCVNLTVDSIHLLLNACPRLTHVSLTGVQAFLRPDLTAFCREAPSDFTLQQREVFCVFSGDGVSSLRSHLNTLYSEMERRQHEQHQLHQTRLLQMGNRWAPPTNGNTAAARPNVVRPLLPRPPQPNPVGGGTNTAGSAQGRGAAQHMWTLPTAGIGNGQGHGSAMNGFNSAILQNTTAPRQQPQQQQNPQHQQHHHQRQDQGHQQPPERQASQDLDVELEDRSPSRSEAPSPAATLLRDQPGPAQDFGNQFHDSSPNHLGVLNDDGSDEV